MSSSSTERIRLQVESLRQKLLDLTLRNRMLNYKPSKRLSLEISGENSEQIYRLLVLEEKRFSVVGTVELRSTAKAGPRLFGDEDPDEIERLRKEAEKELDQFLDIKVPTQDSQNGTPVVDRKFGISEPNSIVQGKLRAIEREARLANDELGINTLFLTLGSLEWNHPGEKSCRAPLLFIPVTLVRLASGSLKLQYDGTDVGGNLPLRAKLAEFNLVFPEFRDETSTGEFFAEVEEAIKSHPEWTLRQDEVFLSFFNYEKYSMYVDLGGELWPEGGKPWEHSELIAMLGDGFDDPHSLIDETTQIDEFRPVQESREVFDADSSQSIAMIRAKSGLSIVVEGPPGTGKSQTITNIIAEAVGNGKTVLFVSAKRAALDVVKRNLTRADLAPICLDLHDRLTNRREFYEEIKKTVNSGVRTKSDENKVQRLNELRNQLNHLVSSVNESIEPFGATPFDAMSLLAQLPPESGGDRMGRVDFERLVQLSSAEFEMALPSVSSLQDQIRSIGIPSQHPFWGCEIDYSDPGQRLDLGQSVRTTLEKMINALDLLSQASLALRIPEPASLRDIDRLGVCIDLIDSAPPTLSANLSSPDWETSEQALRGLITDMRLSRSGRSKLKTLVEPSIWPHDLSSIARELQKHSESILRFVNPSFRSAMRELEPLVTSLAPADPRELRTLVSEVIQIQAAEREILSKESRARELFGRDWLGLNSDPDRLLTVLDWVLRIKNQVSSGTLPDVFLLLFDSEFDRSQVRQKVAIAIGALREAIESDNRTKSLLRFSKPFSDVESFAQIVVRIQTWSNHLDLLPAYISYRLQRQKVVALGLEAVADLADTWSEAREKLTEAAVRSYYSGVLRHAIDSRPALKQFRRADHESAISEFCRLDDFKLLYNRALVRLSHQQRLPTFGPQSAGNLKTLMLQCQLQRKHRPIRWIMGQSGEAIQKIKPVFMMSPLSVAVHLPPELPKFDLVIFDEASQIRPEDSLSSIVRGRQIVVVGDTRQMPPTNFFANLTALDDEVEDEDSFEAGEGEARKLESILSLMSAVTVGRVRKPDLRWHYRSIHPSLIEPSNEMFYDRRLVIFPSPGSNWKGRKIGIVSHFLKDAIYEGSTGGRVNRVEAQFVADAVLEHVRTSPEESLLVAAIKKPQSDLIYEKLSLLERSHPIVFERYRELNPHEPLEVKNLENIQGDERDVVFISITYGRDKAGVLRQQFGPLLQEGGERRLNVLITRARKRCEVFASMVSDEIRASESQNGVGALKRYLKFAETGNLDRRSESGDETRCLLREQVSEFLFREGFSTVARIGSEGLTIDLGVLDPSDGNRIILGIELDGPTYGQARSARDRDKLRPRVLQERGWLLHRIWSHDWWQDRSGEKARLLGILQPSQESMVEAQNLPVIEPAPPVVEEELPLAKPPQTRPYIQAVANSIDDSVSAMAAFALEVVGAEGPIVDELLRSRIKEAASIKRESAQTAAKLDEALGICRAKVFASKGCFYARPEQLLIPRDWSGRPTGEKKAENIPYYELFAALRAVISISFGIQLESATRAAFQLIGFKKPSESALAKANSIAHDGIRKGQFTANSDLELYLAPIEST